MREPTQHDPTADLAAAVDATDRAPRARLLADWNGDGHFQHPLSDLSPVAGEITVERQISGDLPAECTLIEGYTTATLSATLAGTRASDPRDIARMLSPYRTDSPLRGHPLVDTALTCDLGLLTASGRQMRRQFTGTTRTLTLSAAARTVDMSALDPAEQLRASVTLPPAAQPQAQHYNTDIWPYQWRVNTQWVIDYVLRRNGIYASPPPRENCLFAMTCHGGLIPDIGFAPHFLSGHAPGPHAPLFIDGPYGLLAANANATTSASVSAQAMARFQPGYYERNHLIEFWCQAGEDNTFGPRMDGEILMIASATPKIEGVTYTVGITSTGSLSLRLYSARDLSATVPGPTLSGTSAWHQVGVWVRYDARGEVVDTRWLLDGHVGDATRTTAVIDSLYQQGRPDVTVSTPVPIACVRISEVTDPPADWGTGHEPQADIDTGLNWMTGLPDVAGADSFDVITQAAAAEFGVITFTEEGRFRFLNRDTIAALAARPSVKTLTATTSLTALSVSTSLDSVRNEITMSVTPRLRAYHPHVIYQPATIDELDTRPGTSTRVVTLTTRCAYDGTVLSIMDKDTYLSDTYGLYSAARAIHRDTGAEVTSGLSVSAFALDADHVELTFRNDHDFWVRYQLDGSTPALRLIGYPVVNAHTVTHQATDTTSTGRYGRRVLTVADNPFRHTLDAADTITASLLADLAYPSTVLTDVTVVGDPRGQLLDPVTVTDPHGLGGPISGTVIGSRREINTSDGLTDHLTLRVTPASP